MKKQTLALALLASVGFIGTAAAADGTITFNGSISATTCKIDGSEAGGANDKTVVMPLVNTKTLGEVGATAGFKQFSITLGGSGDTGCTNGKLAKVNFDPSSQQINSTTGNLTLAAQADGTVGASNVEIQVLDAKDKVLDLRHPSSNTETVAIVDNTAVLNYGAQYIATGAASAGAVSSSVKYSLSYN